MKMIWVVIGLVLAVTIAPAAAASAVVRVDAGLIRGVSKPGLTVFKGVPFAAPPTGPLRRREPAPAKPWRGVRLANRFAAACMQTGVSMPGEAPPTVSEDCLYLNIWTPARDRHARHPVIVWIYGGGFSNGSASMPLYWGDALARKGVILVTIAYRVGPFGYLALPELTAESPHRSSGNYGLEDQVAALRWVRDNISAFGGDPRRVTIAGQSAGAASVSMLMASPLARGLFQRAIGESGGMFEPMQLAPGYQLANAEMDGEAYEASVGARSLGELRALPAPALLAGKRDAVTHPVIEPYALPASPYEVFAAGRQNDVPILIGSNADEARSLITDLASVRAATFAADIANRWGALPPELLAPYPHGTDAEAVQGRLAFERDLRFGWDVWAWARLEATTGRSSVYYYHFAHAPPFPAGSVYAGWGPSHFAELWYVFDHLSQEPWRWTGADRTLAQAMSDYWVNFAKSGDPNGPDIPLWPQFNRSGEVIDFDEAISVGAVANLPTLKVFDAVYTQVRGAPLPKSGR